MSTENSFVNLPKLEILHLDSETENTPDIATTSVDPETENTETEIPTLLQKFTGTSSNVDLEFTKKVQSVIFASMKRILDENEEKIGEFFEGVVEFLEELEDMETRIERLEEIGRREELEKHRKLEKEMKSEEERKKLDKEQKKLELERQRNLKKWMKERKKLDEERKKSRKLERQRNLKKWMKTEERKKNEEKSKKERVIILLVLFLLISSVLVICYFCLFYLSQPTSISSQLSASPPLKQIETAIYVDGEYSPGLIDFTGFIAIANIKVTFNSNLVANKPFIVTINKGFLLNNDNDEVFRCEANVSIKNIYPLEYQCILENMDVKYTVNAYYTVSIQTYPEGWSIFGPENIKFEDTYFSVKY